MIYTVTYYSPKWTRNKNFDTFEAAEKFAKSKVTSNFSAVLSVLDGIKVIKELRYFAS